MLVVLIADAAEYVMNEPLTRRILNDLVQAEPLLNSIANITDSTDLFAFPHTRCITDYLTLSALANLRCPALPLPGISSIDLCNQK